MSDGRTERTKAIDAIIARVKATNTPPPAKARGKLPSFNWDQIPLNRPGSK